MEEADILGDRIVIIDRGQVKCYGTPLFLKKTYGMNYLFQKKNYYEIIYKYIGTGYNLTIVKEELFNESNLIAAVKQIIPEAEIQRSWTAHVVINVPSENTNKLPDVLQLLEKNKKGFCIKGIDISLTTMEEVFLK